MFWIIIGSFAVLLCIAIVVYMMPEETAAAKAKKRKEKEKKERASLIPDPTRPAVPEKDWKSIAERWERNNNALLGDIEKLKMQEKKAAKELEEAQGRVKELTDKLALEKGWREKEQDNLDKIKTHESGLKDQITRTEKDLEKEHSQRLRLEREYQDLKVKYDAVQEERRSMSTKAMSLQTTLDQVSKDLKTLRRENEELKKKREDVQWVAKSEFDELQRQYNKLKEQAP